MKKDILFIAATHGDEPIGKQILERIEDNSIFELEIGNPKALIQKKRFLESDLNRSAPGNPKSSLYEERRAYEILKKSKNYKYTIDIHGSIKDNGIFIIITNPTRENLKLASLLNIQNIVIWPSENEQAGALSQYFSCGIEIECGEKTDPRVMNKLEKILRDFLTHYTERENTDWKERLNKRRLFYMDGPIRPNEISDKNILKEFTPINIHDEIIFPVFIGSYEYNDIIGYKLKQYTLEQILKLT